MLAAVRRARRLFIAWMVIAIAAVTALAYWDEQRESAAALADMAEAQTTTARALAAGLAPRVAQAADEAEVARVLASARAVEQPHVALVLFRRPDRDGLVTTSDAPARAPPIEAALASGETSARLSRPESASLGLPARTALAGLASMNAGARGAWAVAVVTSAERERDRERRAAARLVLGVLLAAGLVLAFGGAALARERKELAIGRELARAEQSERLERAAKLAALGALASGVAHEVSTPLGVIVGRAEQLAPKVQDDERASRAVQAILDQADRIKSIVRGILALVRGDDVSFEKARAIDLVASAVALVSHRFEKQGVELAFRDRSDGASISCEKRLFEQVLVNLLLNACDACARGGHVAIEASREAAGVAFEVLDDGAGIAPEIAARAVDPFVSTKGAAGSGMGLAIASEIVKHHRGELTIAPREGARGTRARVVAPAADAVV